MPPRVIAAACAAALLMAAPASGHRLDEYLQAIRIEVGLDRILLEVDLTPGASLAADELSTIDANGDSTLGPDEERAYVARFLERLELSIDGERRRPSLSSAHFPSRDDLLDGAGIIRLVLTADGGAGEGTHRLIVRNLYRPEVGVYLANALRPAARGLTISAQQRDPKQQQLQVDYRIETGPLSPRSVTWAIVAVVLLGLNVWWRRRPPSAIYGGVLVSSGKIVA